MSDRSKYDSLSRHLIMALDADAVVLVVINGNMGHGACPAFRVDDPAELPPLKADAIRALRLLADAMERDEVPPHITDLGRRRRHDA